MSTLCSLHLQTIFYLPNQTRSTFDSINSTFRLSNGTCNHTRFSRYLAMNPLTSFVLHIKISRAYYMPKFVLLQHTLYT
ncbi:hypothetical protein HanIR_Chr01g0036361 [Helianthus annuus]|nr:hypothetical protein HanIR_Chr01g0036361 [Helianthus annuus]